jgi:hypothetical protein
MSDTPDQRRYRQDALVLGDVGRHLTRAELPPVTVRLPRALAEQAVAAWERDSSGPLEPEDLEQYVCRHRAGTLALIGLSIVEGGKWADNDVEVALDPVFIGLAVDAADGLPAR